MTPRQLYIGGFGLGLVGSLATVAGLLLAGATAIGVIALGYGRGLLDRDEAASRMRVLQRETSLFVTEAVVERGIRMLDEQ